jgi:hypothetical protein
MRDIKRDLSFLDALDDPVREPETAFPTGYSASR